MRWLRNRPGPARMMNGSITARPNRHRKNVTSNGCMPSEATRISTFITTLKRPLSSIHSAARVVGAGCQRGRRSGSRIHITRLCSRRAPPYLPAAMWVSVLWQIIQWQAVHKNQGLFARIVLADPGIRRVIKRDAEPTHIIEAIRKFCAGAKFCRRAEIGPRALREKANGAVRGHHPIRPEIDVEGD